MLLAAPPPPPPLVVVAPAEREASFGRVAGRVPRGRWAVVVRLGSRTLAVRSVSGGSFDFSVPLPRRDATITVTAYSAHARARSAVIRHVFGLPRSASPRPVGASLDAALERTLRSLTRSFPGTSAVYVEDLVSGRGAAWNARARFPAASTLKLAIAVEALRSHSGKPESGSYLDALLRRMLIDSDDGAANDVEATFGGGRRVDELLRGVGLVDTWMAGGYLRRTQGSREPIPTRVESQPSFGCCKYTTAYDLARLHSWIHLAAGGRGPLIHRYGREFTQSDARYLLYLLAHVPDRGKLGRFLGGPEVLLHKAGWISGARHDAGLVYWPGGVFVAAVMTWGRGVGEPSDLLAGRLARSTLARLRRLG